MITTSATSSTNAGTRADLTADFTGTLHLLRLCCAATGSCFRCGP